MAVIKSGDSTDQLHVDPNKAALVRLRDANGNDVSFPSSGLTDGQLRASAVPVAVTNFPATQPVSGSVNVGNFPASQPVSGAVAVNNFPATQPVSGTVNVGNLPATQPVSGSVAVSNFPAPPSLQPISATPTDMPDASLLATGTAAVSTGFTLTLPAIGGMFHYITLIEITKMNGLAITAAGVAQLITSTNLPGPLTWTYGNGEGGVTIGASSSRVFVPAMPLRSVTAGQPTTIVFPAVTGVIWRINVWYQGAA